MRFIFALVLIFSSPYTFAASKPPAPSDGSVTQTSQQKATAAQQSAAQDNRGTEEHPVLIKIVPSVTANADSEKAEDHRLKESAEAHSLTYWTCVLAIITGLIFFASTSQIGS